jgi:chloramphenicol O-acetyltransferase type B
MSIKKIIKKFLASFYSSLVKMKCHSYQKPLKINGFSVVTSKTFLGKNVNFNGMRISGGGNVTIGDNFHSGRDCLIISQIHNYNSGKAIPYDNTYILKDVVIKDNVWIGDRVIILGGVTLGEGCIIQAGSVVVKDIPDFAIAGGHPAIVFSERNKEHYTKLKETRKFH